MATTLDGLAKRLSDSFLKYAGPAFELNQPLTATMKNRMGQYRKHPLIGGEEFTPTSAYMGKSGKMIIVFRPIDTHIASRFSFMEMDATAARATLEGFSRFMDNSLSMDFDEQVRQIREEAGAEEREAHMRGMGNHYQEAFGSW